MLRSLTAAMLVALYATSASAMSDKKAAWCRNPNNWSNAYSFQVRNAHHCFDLAPANARVEAPKPHKKPHK